MHPALSTVLAWLKTNEWLALWVEGLALLAIFFWDRKDHKEDHAETIEQMKIMSRNAVSTETAANAANKSAEALTNSERAWVFADIRQLPEDFAPQPDSVGIASMPISLRNYGKTPARIVRLYARALPIDIVYGLPAEPEYRNVGSVDFVLPPNVSVGQGIAIVPVTVSVPISDFIAIREEKSFLFVYGLVDYIDFGTFERQTRFCWRYHVPHGFNQTPEGFHGFPEIPSVYTRCS